MQWQFLHEQPERDCVIGVAEKDLSKNAVLFINQLDAKTVSNHI